jgi:hypothetical protein
MEAWRPAPSAASGTILSTVPKGVQTGRVFHVSMPLAGTAAEESVSVHLPEE